MVAIWFPREVSIRSLTPVERVGDCSIWFGGFGQVCLVRFGLVVSGLFWFGLVWKASREGVHRCRSLTREGWLQVATNAVLEGASGGTGVGLGG